MPFGSAPARVPVALYYQVVRNDYEITEFVVCNPHDPRQEVHSWLPDGTAQVWHRHERAGRYVFTPPDGYTGGPVGWVYDETLQAGQRMPQRQLEQEALLHRKSVAL